MDIVDISDVAMLEIGASAPQKFLDMTRGIQHCSLQVCHLLRWHTPPDPNLDAAMEVLGGNQLWGVQRQIEHLDWIGVLFTRTSHDRRRVNARTYRDEEHLAGRAPDPSLHEHNQPLCARTSRVNNEPHFPLIRHRGDHRETPSAGKEFFFRRLPKRRIAASTTLVLTKPSLVTPADLGAFPLRPHLDLAALALTASPSPPHRHARTCAAPRDAAGTHTVPPTHRFPESAPGYRTHARSDCKSPIGPTAQTAAAADSNIYRRATPPLDTPPSTTALTAIPAAGNAPTSIERSEHDR